MKSKYTALAGILSLSALVVGCSSPSEITTRGGQTIVTSDEPKVKKNEDFITYEKGGKEVRMHKDEVSKIEEID